MRGYGCPQPTWRAHGEPVRGAAHAARATAAVSLHTSSDAMIPILMSWHVVLAASPAMSSAARVGAEVERTLCDSAVSWHVRAYMHHVSRVCRPCQTAAPM